jgi:hypothetical protein
MGPTIPSPPSFFPYIPHHHNIPFRLYISLGFVVCPVCPSYDYYAPAQQLGLYRPMPHPWPNVAHHLHPRIISMCVAYPQKGRGCIYVHDAIVLYRDTLHYNLLQPLQYIYSYYTSTPPAHLICIETRQRFFSRQGRFSPPPVKCQMMLRDCHPENKCDKR